MLLWSGIPPLGISHFPEPDFPKFTFLVFSTLFLGGGQVCSYTETHPSLHFPLGHTPTPTPSPRSFAGHAPLPPSYPWPRPFQDPPRDPFGPAPFKTRLRGLFGSAPCLPPPTPDPAPLCSAPSATLTSSPTRKATPNPARPRLPGRAPPGPPAPHLAARAAAWAPPAAILRRLPPPSASAPPPAPPALKAQASTPPVPLGNTRPTRPLLL